jgi:hypothetical protein
MKTPGVLFFLVFGCGVAAIYFRDAVAAWRRWRGVRLVTCPETSRTAAVTVDTAHAATTAFFENAPSIRLSTCSRWSTRGPCRQPCLHSLIREGDAAMVETVATQWYADQTCVFCGKRIARVTSGARPPALAGPDGLTVEWPSLPPEQLTDAFHTHRAVCWDCHLIESFRRQHPDLYIDRPSPRQH